MIRSVGVRVRAARADCTISAIAKVSSRSPSPDAALTAKTWSPRASRSSPHDVGHLAAVGYVDLVERDQPRAVVESAVRRELVLDHVEVVVGVASGLDGDGVDHVHDGRAALDVAEELVAEAAALARALDQAGHVGHGERGVAGGDHAEVGDQRRERVVGDLGAGPRDRGDQARLAGARVADQADVGDDLELEHDLQLVAGLAEEREARAPCAWRWPAPRCRGRRDRPGRRPARCRRRPGRRAARRLRWRRRCRRGPAAPGRRRGRRCGGRRHRGRRARPARCGLWW